MATLKTSPPAPLVWNEDLTNEQKLKSSTLTEVKNNLDYVISEDNRNICVAYFSNKNSTLNSTDRTNYDSSNRNTAYAQQCSSRYTTNYSPRYNLRYSALYNPRYTTVRGTYYSGDTWLPGHTDDYSTHCSSVQQTQYETYLSQAPLANVLGVVGGTISDSTTTCSSRCTTVNTAHSLP